MYFINHEILHDTTFLLYNYKFNELFIMTYIEVYNFTLILENFMYIMFHYYKFNFHNIYLLSMYVSNFIQCHGFPKHFPADNDIIAFIHSHLCSFIIIFNYLLISRGLVHTNNQIHNTL